MHSRDVVENGRVEALEVLMVHEAILKLLRLSYFVPLRKLAVSVDIELASKLMALHVGG